MLGDMSESTQTPPFPSDKFTAPNFVQPSQENYGKNQTTQEASVDIFNPPVCWGHERSASVMGSGEVSHVGEENLNLHQKILKAGSLALDSWLEGGMPGYKKLKCPQF